MVREVMRGTVNNSVNSRSEQESQEYERFSSNPSKSPMVRGVIDEKIPVPRVKSGVKRSDYSCPECEKQAGFVWGFENRRSPPVSIFKPALHFRDTMRNMRGEQSAQRFPHRTARSTTLGNSPCLRHILNILD